MYRVLQSSACTVHARTYSSIMLCYNNNNIKWKVYRVPNDISYATHKHPASTDQHLCMRRPATAIKRRRETNLFCLMIFCGLNSVRRSRGSNNLFRCYMLFIASRSPVNCGEFTRIHWVWAVRQQSMSTILMLQYLTLMLLSILNDFSFKDANSIFIVELNFAMKPAFFNKEINSALVEENVDII